MARNTRPQPEIPFQVLTAVGEDAPSIREKLELAQHFRRESSELSSQLDGYFLELINTLKKGLISAEATQAKLKGILEKLTAPPLLAARYWGPAAGPCAGAWIYLNGGRRLVTAAEGVDLNLLTMGDEVLVNADGILITKSNFAGPFAGSTIRVDRVLPDGRLLLRSADDITLAQPVATLKTVAIKPGDLVRFDEASGIALERIDYDAGSEFLVESVPDLPIDQVGGQDNALHSLITALTLTLTNPERSRKYNLLGQRTILLVGKPGVGKTLRAKVAAAQVQRLLGKQCHICVVKPGQFEDPYIGVTQRRIRDCFNSLRASGGFGILFLDELESIARVRGSGLSGTHSDKFLAALLAELQGFESDDANNNIAVIACTNRLELLDPAIIDRMEIQIHVDRPNLAAARSIFSIHLPNSLPFHPNGDQATQTRHSLIEHAVSRLYCVNGDNHISRIRFRDGAERVISARELASGRCFSQIARAACQLAALREIHGGIPGLTLDDIDEAVSGAIGKLSTLLTRENVHQYLDLRQDVDVVAVEPVVRRNPHAHRYLAVS